MYVGAIGGCSNNFPPNAMNGVEGVPQMEGGAARMRRDAAQKGLWAATAIAHEFNPSPVPN
jgi:hypothetical protein